MKPALDLIASSAAAAAPAAAGTAPLMTLDIAALAEDHRAPGRADGPVYKITIGRPDIDLREHGATIKARMGLNTWAAFAGTDADAMVAGDVAMLETEVTPVLKALRTHGIEVVAIHHHMTGRRLSSSSCTTTARDRRSSWPRACARHSTSSDTTSSRISETVCVRRWLR